VTQGQHGCSRQACSGYSEECLANGELCRSFSMTVPRLPLSEPPSVSNSQQSWWDRWSPACYTQSPAEVSLTVSAILAACREEHSGSVRIKLHSLSGSIAGPDAAPLDSNLGAALSPLLMQFDAKLGGVACQLAVDLGSDDPNVRIVSRAPIHLDRHMYVTPHAAKP
jgi:hypothetical protein